MSLSKSVKASVAVLGGAALVGWGTAVYLWSELQSEALTATEAIAEIKDNVEGMQDFESHMEQLKAEISKADIDLEAKKRTLNNREQQIVEVKHHLAEVKSEIAANQDQLGEVKTEIDQGKATIDQHEVTLAALRQDQTSLEESMTKARAELDDVTTELEAERAMLQEPDPGLEDHPSWDPLAFDPVMTTVPVQTPMGLRVSLVHFDRGSSDVSPGGQRKANEVAAWIKTYGAETIQIMGFADTRGSQAANKELSEKRARSIAALLEHAGISRTKLEIIPHGEDLLPEATKDQVSEPLNRCVGIFIAPDPAVSPG